MDTIIPEIEFLSDLYPIKYTDTHWNIADEPLKWCLIPWPPPPPPPTPTPIWPYDISEVQANHVYLMYAYFASAWGYTHDTCQSGSRWASGG